MATGLLVKDTNLKEAPERLRKCFAGELSAGLSALSKGCNLLQEDRLDEAFQAFRESYSLKETYGERQREYLPILFRAWGNSAFFYGLDAILMDNLKGLQKGVSEYLDVLEKASAEGMEDSLGKLLFREPSEEQPEGALVDTGDELIIYALETAELREALEELQLAIRLLSIKDPFEGFRALSKEISKVWPEGLSAVDAVREQRDREWNT